MSSRLDVEGIITALVTPFDDSGAIKEEALKRLVEFQLKKGVHGFFPLGTTGQAPMMSIDERKRVAKTVVEATKQRVPVIVQVGAPDTDTTINLAKHAENIGADAVACVTPYYYQPDEEAIISHYQALAKSITLPVLAYNIPRNTGLNIKPETLLKLSETKALVGLKDSSRDFLQLLETIEILPKDFIVIAGTEGYLLPAFIMGARGAVSALSNAFPELFVELYGAFKKGNLDRAKTVQFKLNKVKRIAERPSLSPIYEILRERGIDCGNPRRPLRPMTKDEKTRLLDGVRKLGLL